MSSGKSQGHHELHISDGPVSHYSPLSLDYFPINNSTMQVKARNLYLLLSPSLLSSHSSAVSFRGQTHVFLTIPTIMTQWPLYYLSFHNFLISSTLHITPLALKRQTLCSFHVFLPVSPTCCGSLLWGWNVLLFHGWKFPIPGLIQVSLVLGNLTISSHKVISLWLL